MGLDLARLSAAATNRIRVAPWPSIAVVGRLTPEKNLSRVVDAFRILRTGGLHASLTFIGAPAPGDRAWAVPHEPGIFHVPWLDEPFSYIAGADLVVSASLKEGFPMVLAEALALGVPVVAVSNRGTRRLQQTGGVGLTLVSAKPVHLATAMEHTLTDYRDTQNKAHAGRAWSQEAAVEFHRHAIERVLQGNLVGRPAG
jgi:glycosyltransferase involved in cell wall biosynthesis